MGDVWTKRSQVLVSGRKADLLVDGEELGGAAVMWDRVAHRPVGKRLQRTRDVEFLIDHLRRHKGVIQ